MKVTINPAGELDAIQFVGTNAQEVVDFCIPVCISVSPSYPGSFADTGTLSSIQIVGSKGGYLQQTYWIVKGQNSLYGIYSDADFQATFTIVS